MHISFVGLVVIALLAFAAVKALSWVLGHLNEPRAWFALFGLMLVGLFFLGMGTIRVQRIVPGEEVEISTPMAQIPPGYNSYPPAPPVAAIAPHAEQPPQSQPSIEELWKQLTAPRINLEEATADAPTMGPSSPQELTEAARVILSASLPGADPFTQGWLVNAAKTILGMPVSEQDQLELRHVLAEALAKNNDATQAESESLVAAVVAATTPAQNGVDSFAHAAQAMSVSTIVEQPQHDSAKLVIAKSIAALPKPDWVLNPPKQIGNVRKFVLESDPYATEEECRRELDEKMQKLVLDRAIELSQASFSGNRFGDPNLYNLGLGEDYIRRELCTDEFVDTVDSSVGEMKKSYVLLEFNEAQDALLVDRARSHARREGLVDTTLLAAFAFGSVAALFGLFKIDTWTRGYYTKRLFLGVPTAIITVLTLLAWA